MADFKIYVKSIHTGNDWLTEETFNSPEEAQEAIKAKEEKPISIAYTYELYELNNN